MIDKLKRIKDFDIDNFDVIELEVRRNNDPQTGEDKCFISEEKLKAEAVKWFNRSDGNKHKFIREFFNLTDEDLENE